MGTAVAAQPIAASAQASPSPTAGWGEPSIGVTRGSSSAAMGASRRERKSTQALLLIGAGWRAMSVPLRVFSVVFGVAASWTLLDAGARRLPAVLGW